MKVVILAGGYGSRLGEETERKPKPMVEINGYPILWHIMKHYHSYGFDDFVILCGYKGHAIKEYFVNYCLHHSDVVVDTTKQRATYSNNQAERWRAMPMRRGGNGVSATIPPDYTDSSFHLQFYVSAVAGDRVVLAPGLRDTLDNEPYLTALQV